MVESYLVHHGILGQKWGIRRYQNEDGTLTAEGRKRQKELTDVVKEYEKADRDKDYIKGIKKQSELKENKYVKEILDEIGKVQSEVKEYDKEVNELFKEYDNNQRYYWALAGAAKSLSLGNGTIADIANGIQGCVYDDLDQGWMNSYSIYAEDKVITDKCIDLNWKYADNIKKTEDMVKDLVGSFETEKYILDSAKIYEAKVNKMIKDMKSFKDIDNESYKVDEAVEGSFDAKDKANINKAKDLLSKASYKNINYYWYNLPYVIDKLNLSNTKYDELTNSDWDKINKESQEMYKNQTMSYT